MEDIKKAILNANENKNWYASLFLSLTIPDICGKLENPSMNSKDRYINWFNRYIKNSYTDKNGFEFLTGDDCYALRCAVLHEASDEIEFQRARKILNSIKFTNNNSHCNYINVNDKKILQLNIKKFTEDIISAFDEWYNNIKDNKKNIKDNKNMKQKIENIVKIEKQLSIGNGAVVIS